MRITTTISLLSKCVVHTTLMAAALHIGQLGAHAQLVQETHDNQALVEQASAKETPAVGVSKTKQPLAITTAIIAEPSSNNKTVKPNSVSANATEAKDNNTTTSSGDPKVIQSTKKVAATPSSSTTPGEQPNTQLKRLALVDENEAAASETEITESADEESSSESQAPALLKAEDLKAEDPEAKENEPASTPVAEDIDLSDPVLVTPATIDGPNPEPPKDAGPPISKPDVPPKVETSTEKQALILLGEEVAPGTSARLSWSPDQHFAGIATPTPVLVVNGSSAGKNMCLTAAVHGDELNGIEIVRRVMYDLDPKILKGAVIGIPIVNLQGFRRNSRYLPDRRDLNRFFPGSAHGSSASRIAHSFFEQIVTHCDALVDIHTGSFLRTNLPQLRADMTVPEVAKLTEGFGATAVLHSVAANGTLRQAAVAAGVPTVTLETGEPSRLQEKEIEHGTKGIQTLLNKLNMTRRIRVWGDPEPVYYQSVWVRADQGGLLFNNVKLGQRVRKNQLLGTITDPITNVRVEVKAPNKGRILGMALNQVVMPGFAAFRIGIPTTETEVVQPSESSPESVSTPNPQNQTPEQTPTQDNAPNIDSEDENSE